MKSLFLKLLLFGILLESCSSWKDNLIITGNQNDAINNAINDFIRRNKFKNEVKIYSIYFESNNKDILGLSISPTRNKIAVITEDEVNYSYNAFPTNYLEKDSSLFIWKDTTQTDVPYELIKKLHKMNMVDTAIVGNYLPPRLIDDSQKAVHYYFCRKNLRKYKVVFSRHALGLYEPPDLKCHKK